MVEQVFGALFLATIFVPAAAVVFGVVLLAWPGRKIGRGPQTVHHAPVRA
jgi:hypothetical protein